MSDTLLLLPGQPVPSPPSSSSTTTAASASKAKPLALGSTLLAAGPGTYALGPHLLSSRVGYAFYRPLPGAAASSVAADAGKGKGKGKLGAGADKAQTQTVLASVGPSRSSSSYTGKRKRGGGGAQAGAGEEDDVVRIPGQGGIASIGAQDAPDQGLIMPRQDSIVIGRITRVNARQATLSILIVDGQPCGVSTRSLSQTPAGAHAPNAETGPTPTLTAALFAAATGEGNHAAGEEGSDFTGVIRAQDVRATEKDKVRMADCFRVGDIVRASVISLGDARSYFLSTAENRLGVIYAISSSAPPIRNVSLVNQGASTAVSSSTSSSTSSSSSSGFLSSAADMLEPWSIRSVRRAGAKTGAGAEAEVPMEPVSWQEMRDVVTGIIEKRKCAKPDVLG